MQKMITTLKDILTPLCKRKTDIWENTAWPRVFTAWPPIARENLEGLFRASETGEIDFSESSIRGKVIYLPPLERDPNCFPILSLYFKLQEPHSIGKLRVLLVKLDEEQEPDRIYRIGFRMETPETLNQNADIDKTGGLHDFYHAQLIRKFGQPKLDDRLQLDCPIWLPQSQPSFPLPAECPVTLLLCLIVALYGRKYYNDFVANHGIFDIQKYRDKLDPWINPLQI